MHLLHPTRASLRVGIFAVGMAYCALAPAAGATASGWALSGFGTLGFAHSNGREADYTSSVMKASGAGYTRAWSPAPDSRLGVQLDVTLDSRWSGVVQVVSEQHLDSRYKPRIEWANIKYQATPDLALRAGRIALPVFLAADYRKVGYADAWVREPVELYGALPVASSDGVDLTFRWGALALRNTTQAFYGHTAMGLTATTHLDASHIVGFSQTIETGPLTARFSALSADLTLDVGRPLFDAYAALGPAGDALADRYEVDHKRATIVSAGLAYDPGRWFVRAEAGRTRTDSFLGKTAALYAGGGLRCGAFTPYAGYAHVRAQSPTSDPGLPLAGMAGARIALAGRLNAGLNSLLQTVPDQSSLSAGLRWDFRPGFALTGQLDRVTPHHGSRGTLINTQPGFEPGHPLLVTSVALDFVF
jgi:hypothetical protein